MKFPKTALFTQKFPRPRIESVEEEIARLFSMPASLANLSGRRIAVAVGSRGIANLERIVSTCIDLLKSAGAKPFIVPAMGSHGGGTPQGQTRVLRGYGVTESRMGAPVEASMDTREIGRTPDGVPAIVGRAAFESEGIVLIARIKPHTDFSGSCGSGLMKMMAVGLAKRAGADSFHSWAMRIPHQRLVETRARALLDTGKALFGLAIIENAYHETAHLEWIPGDKIIAREKALFKKATQWMPSLPVSEADILIIDQIGKDISGAGMDPNVTGRWFGANSIRQETPRITRILVRSLSQGSSGNASGIGLADFCTRRAVEAINRKSTYLNAITSRNALTAHVPLHFDSDRETLEAALQSLASDVESCDARVIRIRDTLNLDRFMASEALLDELRKNPRVEQTGPFQALDFDSGGNLSLLL